MPTPNQYLDPDGVKKLLKNINDQLNTKMDITTINDIRLEIQTMMDYFESGELKITGFTSQ